MLLKRMIYANKTFLEFEVFLKIKNFRPEVVPYLIRKYESFKSR